LAIQMLESWPSYTAPFRLFAFCRYVSWRLILDAVTMPALITTIVKVHTRKSRMKNQLDTDAFNS
jgi:hypothetical protein